MAIRCGLIIEQRPVGIAFPRPKTASGGLRYIPRHRVGRTGPQPTDAPWKNRLRYDGAWRGAATPQKTQQPSTLQCVGNALWDNKGVLALDALSVAASFVPGGKGLVTAGAAVVGSYTGAAALGIGVANRDIPGAAIGAAGHYVSTGAALLDGAKGLAGNLPVAGQALAIGGAAYDVYNSLKEGGCLGGKK